MGHFSQKTFFCGIFKRPFLELENEFRDRHCAVSRVFGAVESESGVARGQESEWLVPCLYLSALESAIDRRDRGEVERIFGLMAPHKVTVALLKETGLGLLANAVRKEYPVARTLVGQWKEQLGVGGGYSIYLQFLKIPGTPIPGRPGPKRVHNRVRQKTPISSHSGLGARSPARDMAV